MSLTNPTVPKKYKNSVDGKIYIGKHTIIGAGSIILPGIHVGEGVSIGANSLVNKDCEPWMVYAGTPAKPIKERIRDRIPELEKQLKKEAYDEDGNYIPKNLWR
jgi:acetyltransferase-like isoleucine patch superfamily enzyme